MWSQDDSESSVTDIPDRKSVSEKLEVANMDEDGLKFAAPKFWLSLIGSSSRRGKQTLKFWKTDDEDLEHQADSSINSQSSDPSIDDTVVKPDKEEPRSSFPLSARDTFKAALVHFGKKWYRRISFLWKHLTRILGSISKLWVSRLRQMFFFNKISLQTNCT